MKKVLLTAILVAYQTAISQTITLEKIKVSHQASLNSVKGETKQLEKEEIEGSKLIDLGEILSQTFPEINHIRKGGTANDIVLRTFSRDDINVLINGARIYNACPNRMDPAIFHVSPLRVEKVIVQEGVFDIRNYGSLGGVVNVLTKKPQKGLHFSGSMTVGSFSYFQSGLQFSGGNDTAKGLVGYQKRYSKPYKTGEGKKFTEYKHPNAANDYKPSEIDHTAFNIDTIWTGIQLTPNEDNQLNLNFGFNEAKDVLYPYLAMDAVYDRDYKFDGSYTFKPLKLKVQAYYNTVKHDMQDRWRKSSIQWTDGTKSTRGYMMRTLAKTKTYGLKVEKTHNFNVFTMTAGVEGFVRNWKADNILMNLDNRGMIPDADLRDLGAYADFSKPIQKHLLSFGLRLDSTKTKARKSALGTANKTLYDEYYGSSYSLSKTDTYLSGYILDKYFFYKSSYVYAGLGHTVRTPNQEERYIALRKPPTKPDWVGNPNLKPVKNNELDIGFKLKKGRFILSGNGFYSKTKDYVYLTKISNKAGTKNALSYKNIDATFYGADFTVKALITDFISADLGGAFQVGRKDNGKDKDIAEIPPAKLRASVSYDNTKFFGTFEAIHAFRQHNVDSTLNETPTPSYTVFNVRAGYKTSHLFIGGGVENLFDKNYYTHLSYLRNPFSAGMKVPEPGRFIYITAAANF